MRSRKPCPGPAVTRTLRKSETTRVPAVTAERSPPPSRITGALSPVIAASLTDATPSTTSPSAGISSPVATSTMSPTRSAEAGTLSVLPPVMRLPVSSPLVARRLAACALPRPSASASAKLPNNTVSHNHSTSCALNAVLPPGAPMSSSTVSSSATTAVTNITGLRISWRGSSLAKAPATAGPIRPGVNSEGEAARDIGMCSG